MSPGLWSGWLVQEITGEPSLTHSTTTIDSASYPVSPVSRSSRKLMDFVDRQLGVAWLIVSAPHGTRHPLLLVQIRAQIARRDVHHRKPRGNRLVVRAVDRQVRRVQFVVELEAAPAGAPSCKPSLRAPPGRFRLERDAKAATRRAPLFPMVSARFHTPPRSPAT